MILVLHACLATLWAVIMRHVEPDGEGEKRRHQMWRVGYKEHIQFDYELLI